VERVRPRPVDSDLAMGAGAARQRTSTTSTGRTRGCPWLSGDQPEARSDTTRLAEEGGTLDGVDGRAAGGTTGARSESVRVGRAMGRSKERVVQDEGMWEEMANAANAEWGRLTASRRCEVYDGRASRKIFLREMGETYRGGGGRLVGPIARIGLGSGVRSDEHPTLGLFLSLTR
jgi:hypothetical protein